MRVTKSFLLAFILLGLTCQPLFAQESIIKDQFEHKRDRKYCFYPSTLRMVNLKQNQEYNNLVNGVEKLLIYTLDSATKADKSYLQLSSLYQQAGFDEYASIFGGGTQMSILGADKGKSHEYVGFFDQDELTIAFYLRGNIPWQKIPTLMKSMNDLEMLEMFDFK